ncbi:cytochrome C [Xanthomonas maliensis]|nr:cytochrome C [Xanthomonas maliensis]
MCAPLAGLLLAGALLSPSAHAADGSSTFLSECADCHSPTKGKNKKGPSLFGVVGRPAASVPDYTYSDALKGSHWTWTPAQLKIYLSQKSSSALPGTKMKYDGLGEDPKELDALIAYLNTLH